MSYSINSDKESKIEALSGLSEEAKKTANSRLFAYLALRQVEKDQAAGLTRMSGRSAMFLSMYNVKFAQMAQDYLLAAFYDGYIKRAIEEVAKIKQEALAGIKSETLSQERRREMISEAEYHDTMAEFYIAALEAIEKRWQFNV